MNNLQVSKIICIPVLYNKFGDRSVWCHGEFKDFQGPV